MLREKFIKRFRELDSLYANMPWIHYDGNSAEFAPEDYFQKWATSAQNLICTACGESSVHNVNFTARYDYCNRGNKNDASVKELYGVFQSAHADFEGGYIVDIEKQKSGEIVGDFIAMARQALDEGHKDVASVLASAALEDALKRFAQSNNINVDGKTMEVVVNLLKSSGLVSGPTKTILGTMPKLRNAALHAEWGDITLENAGAMIGFTEQFLLSNFG